MVRKLAAMTDPTQKGTETDISELQRLLHRLEFERDEARKERDDVRIKHRKVESKVTRMEEERAIHDRRVTLALAENGAALERSREARIASELKVEQLARQNASLSQDVVDLRAKIVALHDEIQTDPSYRSVSPEVHDMVRAERDAAKADAERAANATIAAVERSKAAIAADIDDRERLRGLVAHLRRELNKLARVAGVFRQHVAGSSAMAVGPWRIDYGNIDKAISDGLVAADQQHPSYVLDDRCSPPGDGTPGVSTRRGDRG